MPVLINFKICDNAEACNAIRVCPTKAFKWNDEKKTLEIDEEKCINCGKCATSSESCQVGAIRYAKDKVELEKLRKELEADERTIKDLMVDRYGAQPINMPFYCEENELSEILTTKKTVMVEVFNDDSIECLIKSIPIKDIFVALDNKDIVYRKLEVKDNNLLNKFDIKELPSLLFFKEGNLIGKIEGYFEEKDKNKLLNEIGNILN